MTREQKLEAACKLVLLFHGAGEWTMDKRLEWDNTIGSLLADDGGRVPSVHWNEATTKNMCDAVRKALAP